MFLGADLRGEAGREAVQDLRDDEDDVFVEKVVRQIRQADVVPVTVN